MRSPKLLYGITFVFLLASVGVLIFLVIRWVQKPQNATPSEAAYNGDPNSCQGNPNAPAKCFDCYKNGTPSQVDITDLLC